MTQDIHDIEAVFAAFRMAAFPYRTFPAPAAAADRRRSRPRTDTRRPEGPGRHAPPRRASEGDDSACTAQAVPASP